MKRKITTDFSVILNEENPVGCMNNEVLVDDDILIKENIEGYVDL